jgi:hypothetical protein
MFKNSHHINVSFEMNKPTTLIAYVGELLVAEKEDGLVCLETKDLRLEKGDWDTVHLDKTVALLDEGDGSRGFLCKHELGKEWSC